MFDQNFEAMLREHEAALNDKKRFSAIGWMCPIKSAYGCGCRQISKVY